MKKAMLGVVALCSLLLGAKQFTVGSRGFFSPSGPSCPTLCVDNFSGSAGSSPSASWTQVSSVWHLNGNNTVNLFSGSSTPGDMWYNAAVFTGTHQSSQLTLSSIDSSNFAGPIVRHQSGSDSYYVFLARNGNSGTGIWTVNSSSLGSEICTASSNTIVNGTVLKIVASGTTIDALINGTSVCGGGVTDSSFSGGSPGVGTYGSVVGFNEIGSWEGTN